AVGEFAAHRERGFAVEDADIGRQHAGAAVDDGIGRQNTVIKKGRQRHLLPIDRIAQLQPEILAQRKAEARAAADGVGIIRDVTGRKLLAGEDVETERYTITKKIRLHERQSEATRVLPVLHRSLRVQSASEQVALGDTDVGEKAVRRRIAAGYGEFAGGLFLHVDIENDTVRGRPRLGQYFDGFE